MKKFKRLATLSLSSFVTEQETAWLRGGIEDTRTSSPCNTCHGGPTDGGPPDTADCDGPSFGGNRSDRFATHIKNC